MTAAPSHPSWGRLPTSTPAQVIRPTSGRAPLPADAEHAMLPYGNGRSYGDSPLNNDGLLVDTRSLDHLLAFDVEHGVLECEPGVLLADILRIAVPQGWFVPVTPGTQYVTVGGAIANDVHGKNHHVAGSFGRHVLDFDITTSDGLTRTCSRQSNPKLFAATIGGLGLTGLITRIRFCLKRIGGPFMDVDTHRFDNLARFFELSEASESDYEYTVAWVDCSARGARLGRGWFMRANHAPAMGQPNTAGPKPGPNFALTPPFSLMNRATLTPLNTLYFHRKRRQRFRALQHYQPYFYPLDGIRNWNRAYGPRGFFQYQCVVPPGDAQAAIAELLERIAAADAGSFLSVLKVFGDVPSPGMLSFPRPGATLALDFPNRGEATRRLLDSLDEVVMAAGGAVYPAKDARMSAAAFQQYFPRWPEFSEYVDPAFSSNFWRRVMGDKQ
ncbi:FAD-binding oxidoreductase [Salinisphaera sp. SPP-AMP-43]|uniref:FAD-binding oxidoreductase n=1 Tax=Salinisphaera sp. SPP-AMP-43 TaxID=3121288 RepID=UPI003C6E9B6E